MEPSDRSAPEVGLAYNQKRSALSWPLMLTGLLAIAVGAVVAIVCVVLSLTVSKGFVVLFAAAAAWTIFWTRVLRSKWPTGIRVDATGIKIGDKRALPFATSQSQTVFACSWSAVRAIAVSERSRQRSLPRQPPGKAGRGRILAMLSRLPAPFTPAVLVIDVDPDAAGAPQTRLVDNAYGFGAPPRRWMTATRRPDALRAALTQMPGCPPVADHVGPDFPDFPDLPDLPGVPGVPGVPDVPDVPDVPSQPGSAAPPTADPPAADPPMRRGATSNRHDLVTIRRRRHSGIYSRPEILTDGSFGWPFPCAPRSPLLRYRRSALWRQAAAAAVIPWPGSARSKCLPRLSTT